MHLADHQIILARGFAPAHGPTNSFAPLLRMGRPVPQLAHSLASLRPALQLAREMPLRISRGTDSAPLVTREITMRVGEYTHTKKGGY